MKTDIGTYTINGFTVIGFRHMRNDTHLLYIVFRHNGIEQTGIMWINEWSENFNKKFYSGEIYNTKIKCKMYYMNDNPDRIIHSFIMPTKLINSWKSEDVKKYLYLFEEKTIDELKEIKKSGNIFRVKMKIRTEFFKRGSESFMGFDDVDDEDGDMFLKFNTDYFENKRIVKNRPVDCLVEVYTSYERDAETILTGIDVVQETEMHRYGY